MESRSDEPAAPTEDEEPSTAREGIGDSDAGVRPFWDVLGTWEHAQLEQHELRYLELKRIFGNDPTVSKELRAAIATARRRFGPTSGE